MIMRPRELFDIEERLTLMPKDALAHYYDYFYDYDARYNFAVARARRATYILMSLIRQHAYYFTT